jgi:hypothetical protein
MLPTAFTTRSSRGRALVVVASALLALGASSASAATITDYAVTIEGHATYERSAVRPGPMQTTETAAFDFWTHYGDVRFTGKEINMSQGASSISNVTARTTLRAGSVGGACSGSTATVVGNGWLLDGFIPMPSPTVEPVGVRVLGGAIFPTLSCTGDFPPTDVITMGGDDDETPAPTDVFYTEFDLPHEAIGMGKIIQLLDAKVTGADCPGHDEHTTSCELRWNATATFVRTQQTEGGPGHGLPDPALVLPPDPPVRPHPDDVVPTPRVLPDPDDVIPSPPAAKLSAKADKAVVTVTCAVACTGTATAYPALGSARAAASRPLARTRFTSKAGRRTTVVLRFRPKARRAIRRAGGVRVVLDVKPRAGGRPVRRTVRAPVARRSSRG